MFSFFMIFICFINEKNTISDYQNYYYNIFITTQVNNNKDFAIYKEKIKEVTIKVPEIKKAKPKLFNLDD